jgi:hypothetical protein
MKQTLAWAALLLAAACAEPAREMEPQEAALDSARGTAESPSTAVPGWMPSESEPEPVAKGLAAEAVLALTNYPVGSTPDRLALAAGLGAAEFAAELVDPAIESRGRVVYAQFVGIGASGASITVLVEQTLRPADGQPTSESRSIEIRLERDGEVWRVSELAAVGGPPGNLPPDMSAEARAVVDHPDIRLPSSARWDIYRGDVDAELLRLLAAVAEVHEIDVLTFVSGRPQYVFDTNVLSNHARGWAVDVYAVDGTPVVEQRREGSAAHSLVVRLYDGGINEIGSPWDLDGPGGRSFTDAAHQDHIHIAVTP